MKKTRFTEEQMVTILREADQRPVPEVAKKNGVSAQTLYVWRKHFGTLEPADVKRLRQLEQENGRLKKMVADRDLEIDVLKEITRKNGRRTRAPAAGRVCTCTRSVGSPRVRLALRRTVHAGLPVAAGRPGCPGAGRDASSGGAVSAVRLSPDLDFPKTRRAHDEHGPDPSPLAPGGVAGASAAAAAPGRPEPAPPGARHCGQSRLGVRLRVRHLREWADAQVPSPSSTNGLASHSRSTWPAAFGPGALSRCSRSS